MNSSTVFTVPSGPDVLTTSFSFAAIWSIDHWTAKAALRTAHYRGDSNGVTQVDPNGNPLRIGGVAIEEHPDVYAELAGNGQPDTALITLQSTVQSAIATYLATTSPTYSAPEEQAFAAAVIVMQAGTFAYCAVARK